MKASQLIKALEKTQEDLALRNNWNHDHIENVAHNTNNEFIKTLIENIKGMVKS